MTDGPFVTKVTYEKNATNGLAVHANKTELTDVVLMYEA